MKFIILRKADENTEANVMPSEELMVAMGQYNESMANASVLVEGMGLQASDKGARISFRNGKPTVTDGPFIETKELLAGFTVFNAPSKQDAIEWVKRWPPLDGDGNVELELRQVFEMSDFEQGEGTDIHEAAFEKAHKQPTNICAYLGFNGNCREAFEFYADCFGGEVLSLRDAPDSAKDCEKDPENIPAESLNKIMHARLQIGPYLLMGGDAPGDMYKPPQGFHVQLEINDLAQAEKSFAMLAEGGRVEMPLAETFWANRFGMLVDRFGIPWMINSGSKMP